MIRLIHNLGGCGGTLLSRCLGVLPGVALFSEINPAAVRLFPQFDPIYQDSQWNHLLEATAAKRFSQIDLTEKAAFRKLIGTFHSSAVANSRHLVLRDFNYIDFVGVPFTAQPPRRLSIYDALPRAVPKKSIAFIRHPIHQWMSLCKHEELTASLAPKLYCDAYVSFLDSVDSMNIHRYEDFVAAPEARLADICADLELPFDGSFVERFHSFDAITGDLVRIRETWISLPQGRIISDEVLDTFNSTGAFQQILERTGYAMNSP